MWVRMRAREHSWMGIHIVIAFLFHLGLGFRIVPSPLVLPELRGCQKSTSSVGVE